MEFPNLHSHKLLSIDIETKDPDLKELGPGPRRPGGYILGVSISTPDQDWYFPLRHILEGTESSFDPANVPQSAFFEWLGDLFKDPERVWVVANGLYDFDWLQYKVPIPAGVIHDILWIEPLLDENKPSYSLENLAQEYLGVGKESDEIAEYAKARKWTGDPRAHLWKMPVPLVAKYARIDTRRTLDVYLKQIPLVEEFGLWTVLGMESGLIPFYLQLRKTGVRVKVDQLHETRSKLVTLQEDAQLRLNAMAGGPVNVNAARQLAALFDRLGVKYGHTAKGNPCFDAAFLETVDHDVAKTILEIKNYGKLDGTFLDGFERYQVNGRIAPLFHPLKGSWGGTVSGRLSSSNPNLQNVSSRNEVSKQLLRGLFIPEEGMLWSKTDYSQIEYRIFAHYALGRGAESLRKQFNDDPHLDLHQYTADLVLTAMGHSLDTVDPALRKKMRSVCKSVNFGVIYGMGAKKMAATVKVQNPEKFLKDFHNHNPFMKHTLKICGEVAEDRGYVKTILGRRAHLSKDMSYVALNRVVQGSAADTMKMAMLKTYQAGVYNVLVPHLTVHDELDASVPQSREGYQALLEQKRIFESAIPFRVPIIAETDMGDTWASASKEGYEQFCQQFA